jgi:hypothetical protein
MKLHATFVLGIALLTSSLALAETNLYCAKGGPVPASSDGIHTDKLLRSYTALITNGINLNQFILIIDVLNPNSKPEKYFQSSKLQQIMVDADSLHILEENGLKILTLPRVSKDIYELTSTSQSCSFYNPVTCTSTTTISQCTTDISLLDTLSTRIL